MDKPAKKRRKKEKYPGVRERNGRFTYRYSVMVVKDGKEIRKQKETPSFLTAKEAYDAGILIEADMQRGVLVDTKNVTLNEWAETWLQDYQLEREPRPTTHRNRVTALNALKKHFGENKKLKDITSNDYQRFLNELKKRGKKQGTIKNYHDGIAMSFSDAVRKNVLPIDPTKSAIIPAFKETLDRLEAELPKYLEKNELKHFLNIVRFRGNPQEYNFFLILAYTGMRIGELLALKTSDIDEQERTISVVKTLTVLKKLSAYKLGPPKNKSSKRVISIGDTVIKAIRAQAEWRRQKAGELTPTHNADFVFWSLDQPGYPASAAHMDYKFDLFLQVAGLPRHLTPHSLRHTHVSLLAEAGVDLAVIQDRLGHKNDEITRRVYLHVTESKRKAAPDNFEKIMNG